MVWPHSPALLVLPRYTLPSVTTAAPTPEPSSAITTWLAPRPAPNHISACPWVFAPFSRNSGGVIPSARISSSSGTPPQPIAWACTTAVRPCSTVPGTPTPTPSTPRSATPACSIAARTLAATWAATSVGSGVPAGSARSTVVSLVRARSNSSVLIPVSPTSTPTTWACCGLTRSSTRGRPPSESTRPASTTSPSSASSPVTLLTVAALSPVSLLRSCRLSGPSKNSVDSSVDRL